MESSGLITLQRELANANLPLEPCLSAADLDAFEQLHQVSLPPEYRFFLAYIGNGGAGPPEYGLRPLGTGENWWFDEQRAAWQHFRAIRRPFPFAQPWCWEDEDEPDETRLAAVYDGSLYLGTDGCGIDWALIVTGPQRGYVWQFSEAGILPCRPALLRVVQTVVAPRRRFARGLLVGRLTKPKRGCPNAAGQNYRRQVGYFLSATCI